MWEYLLCISAFGYHSIEFYSKHLIIHLSLSAYLRMYVLCMYVFTVHTYVRMHKCICICMYKLRGLQQRKNLVQYFKILRFHEC